MASAKGVEGRLVDAGEAAKTAIRAYGWEEVATTSDDFVGVGLMADIPDEFVVGGIEDVGHFGTGGDIVLVEAFHTWHLGCDLVEDYHGHFFVGGFVGGSGAGRF